MNDLDPFMPGHHGVAATGLTIAPVMIAAAWNVQGAPARMLHPMQALFGIALPMESNTVCRSADLAALWLGPSSWLLVGGETSVDFNGKRDALNAAGGALFDVSASRVGWKLAGPRAHDVLESGCPLDFDARAFPSGSCAQSVFGHVNVLIERRDDAFLLLVPRSFARDVAHQIGLVAAQYGYEIEAPVGYA